MCFVLLVGTCYYIYIWALKYNIFKVMFKVYCWNNLPSNSLIKDHLTLKWVFLLEIFKWLVCRPGYFTRIRKSGPEPTRKTRFGSGTGITKLPYWVLLLRTRGSSTWPKNYPIPDRVLLDPKPTLPTYFNYSAIPFPDVPLTSYFPKSVPLPP